MKGKAVYTRKAITLLEIMIVIFLIGIIGAVLGFNMRGSLEKGKIFKSRQAKNQIEEILQLYLAQNPSVSVENAQKNPAKYLQESGLVKNAEELLLDGWGEPFKIKVYANKEVRAISSKLQAIEKQSSNHELVEDEKESDYSL